LKAMNRNMGLVISRDQAEAVVNYYDRTKSGEMSYNLLLKDVMKGMPMLLQMNIDTVRTVEKRDEKLKTNPFIRKDFYVKPNKRVEALKQELRKSLDYKIRYNGGSVRSWLSKIFIAWDPQFTGKISRWQELQGALGKLGVALNEEDAQKIMQTYDVHSNGEFDYNLFAQDVLKSDPSFMADSTSVNDLKSTATGRTPADISQMIRQFRRASEVYSQKSDNSIEPGDLLHGTFLRFDTSRSGKISLPDFKRVCKEVKVDMTETNAIKFVNWFDSDGSGKMDFALLTKQLFGEDVLSRPLSLPTLPRNNLHLEDKTLIQESSKDKASKKALRKKLIIAEKVRVQVKLEAIEKQRQAILDNRKATK